MAAPRVEGVREALDALKEFDPKLRRATNKRIRNSVGPLQTAVRSRLPGVALSNWNGGPYPYSGGDASKGVSVRIGGSKGKTKATWELVTLRQTNAGGIVFDMAGRRNAGKGTFIPNLTRKFGRASRTMWKAAEEKLPQVQSDVLAAVDDAAKLVNRELARR